MMLQSRTWQHTYGVLAGSRMPAACLRNESPIVAKPFGDQRELT